MKCKRQSGVALVVTLIMLSLVTFMAVAFLGVSTRERTSNALTSSQTGAEFAAEAGFARAQAELISRMLRSPNRFDYDLMVSTNFINRAGFNRLDGTNVYNVNYDHLVGGVVPMLPGDRLQNIANLYFDPRPPVYVAISNINSATQGYDFRFYVDLNRNGTNEPNGLLPEVARDGRWFDLNLNLIPTNGSGVALSNVMVGEPEWVGILENPTHPHSASNRFVGRYAYLVLPAGKSLDLNFIHNQAKRSFGLGATNQDGFLRNQGYGSWELNLAGFLADLNTNVWYYTNAPQPYTYLTNIVSSSIGQAFADATDLLRYRYNGDYRNLNSPFGMYGQLAQAVFGNQKIDAYSDGDFRGGALTHLGTDMWNNKGFSERFDVPWPGAENSNYNAVAYYDIQELFATNGPPKYPGTRPYTNFTAVFKSQMANSPATYDRYSFMRLLGQMGVDSAPPTAGAKINLNFDNVPPHRATDFTNWSAIKFFATTANRMLPHFLNQPTNKYVDVMTGTTNFLSITNIPLFPVSHYSAEVHRLLQLTANIYDAMSVNMVSTNSAPYAPTPPTLYRPIFYKLVVPNTITNVFITDYEPVLDLVPGLPGASNSFFYTNIWVSLDEVVTNTAIPVGRLENTIINGTIGNVAYTGQQTISIKGIPVIVGAKKGFPNFNELSMQTVMPMSRNLALYKDNPTNATIVATNQMLILSVSNSVGVELWNSYTSTYPRALLMRAVVETSATLTNNVGRFRSNQPPIWSTNVTANFNLLMPANSVTGNRFVALKFDRRLLPGMILYTNPAGNPTISLTNIVSSNPNVFQNSGPGFTVPTVGLAITNSFRYVLIDVELGRVIDCVTMTNLVAGFDVLQSLRPQNLLVSANSDPGLMWDPTPTASGANRGVTNQIAVSIGSPGNFITLWRNYSLYNKTNDINPFRKFMGLTPIPLGGPADDVFGNITTNRQAPYTPSVRLVQDVSWEVNDPLVHYTVADMIDPTFNNNLTNAAMRATTYPLGLPNAAVPVTYGRLNQRYDPWGGRPGTAGTTNNYNLALKDPGVRGSDDWDFYSDEVYIPFDPNTQDPTFRTNRFASIGWLGRVHRGTPWQTVYMKSTVAETNAWYKHAGSRETHPTNDWKLFDLFTVAINDNAARGILSVNQTNLAAWSAVLSGVPVLTNDDKSIAPATRMRDIRYGNLFIEPNSSQVAAMVVRGINRFRTNILGGVFTNVGGILGAPELTVNSPYLDHTPLNGLPLQDQVGLTDLAYERIPQQIMSLLTLEEYPRVVIYAFGQSLKPAPGRPLVLTPGTFFGLCTNYQVVGETVTRTVLHVENLPNSVGGPITNAPRVVIEKFNIVPALDF